MSAREKVLAAARKADPRKLGISSVQFRGKK